ncbi:MAG: hypothetical protein JWP18_1005 [Solirubrobacterales bacterium]|nr:hypothetical protein [Solirubrobacterales bacterium]
MPRRVTLSLVGAAVGVATSSAAAQAAETYTVNAAAAPGCAAKVCKTVTDAVAAVANGDTIVVAPGTYKEAGTITLARTGVTIRGTAGKTTILPAASAAAGDPTISLAQGSVLDGVAIATATNAGPAVLVAGRDVTVQSSIILRIAPSTQDAPALAVGAGVPGGTTTVTRTTIINGPPGQTAGAEPAVRGNATSTLALSDAFVLSGPGTGPAVGLSGNDKSGAGVPVANTIVRSALVAQRAAADALTVTSAAADAVKKAVALDSSSLLPGSSAAGLRVATLAGLFPAQDVAGDVKVTADHVTVAGGAKPFAVSAASSGATPAGNVEVSFDRSIVHGSEQGTVTSFTPAGGIALPLVTGSANTATIVVSNSDTTQNAVGGEGDRATVAVPGKTTTPDAQLFANLAKLDVHLRQDAPVIDKGGPAAAGTSATDIDGQPRQTGAATDLGADEFLNRAPVAAGTATPSRVAPGAAVTFDGSGSTDPEAASGGGIATYRWAFGDGATQATTTPTTTHAYAKPGRYDATLTVVDAGGVTGAAASIPTVVVVDATAPVVKLTVPKANQAFKVFVTRKVVRGGRTVPVTTLDKRRLTKVLFKGTATDESGIGLVALSIRRVSVAKTKSSATACVYLDGKVTFKTVSCKKPVFFLVPQKAGAFSYRLKSTLQPRAGLYELALRAIDTGGNPSGTVTARFRLT